MSDEEDDEYYPQTLNKAQEAFVRATGKAVCKRLSHHLTAPAAAKPWMVYKPSLE